ncbi:signal protein [Kribbella qitaiheensis]|uniref:Signal protein n=1 Tax=Kribbella qitaiheensis TaxID=1544730 RepID=A0A7G6X4I6_9ACTN|nr:signal protein [Kribbella qitaiheensis]QNE21151.1 signal protein [Kribbella qitaiheensis]
MLKNTAALILALTLAGCSGGSDAPAAEQKAKPVDPRSSVIQSKWWTWAALPEDVNPVADRTGKHCAEQQPDGMWLVAGTFGGVANRACTIPAGLPIVGPVVNTIGADEADCLSFSKIAEGSVKLDDGAPEIIEVDPVLFQFVAKQGNPSGYDAGLLKGYGCGLWFTAGPLKPGTHTLVINGKSGDFSVQATYNLTVKDAAGL